MRSLLFRAIVVFLLSLNRSLSSNKIRHLIGKQLQSLNSVKQLKLNRNNICSLSEFVFDNLSQLEWL